MEAVAAADTIIFTPEDRNLTRPGPRWRMWWYSMTWERKRLLRIAACLEEHFPHSMAKAVVNEAVKRGLVHKEMHSRIGLYCLQHCHLCGR